jgi:hypothetical protein
MLGKFENVKMSNCGTSSNSKTIITTTSSDIEAIGTKAPVRLGKTFGALAGK